MRLVYTVKKGPIMLNNKYAFSNLCIFFISLIIVSAISANADMSPLPDSILEKTVGAGLQISFTGDIKVSYPDGSSIGVSTGSGSTAGAVSLSNTSLSNFRIEPLLYSGDKHPLIIDVKTASAFLEPGMADGTGFINVDLPSLSFKTDTFSGDIATDNDMSDTGIDKLFEISYTSANISLFSGNFKIFAH